MNGEWIVNLFCEFNLSTTNRKQYSQQEYMKKKTVSENPKSTNIINLGTLYY